MSQRTLGIIMHGVTGRMGMNQHLIRSIVAIREQGGVALSDGDARHARPDPGRPQRREGRGAGASARHRALDHRPRRGARRPATTRSSSTPARRRCAPTLLAQGDRTPASTSTARSRSPTNLDEALELCRLRQARGRQARRGAGQAVPARPAQARACCATRGFFGRMLVGARRVRLLGVRGRLAAGAAAVVELPQGGRRRHHPRHAVPLALRARQPVRRGEGGDLPRRHAHPGALGRGAASPTPRPPTTPPTRRSSSTGGVIAQINMLAGRRACAATTS